RQAARGPRFVAERHGAGGYRQARRPGVVRIRPRGRGLWRRRVRARLLCARTEAVQGRDPAEQRVRAVPGKAGSPDAEIMGTFSVSWKRGQTPMANHDDLLKKLADNFAELSARECKLFKEKLGVELL